MEDKIENTEQRRQKIEYTIDNTQYRRDKTENTRQNIKEDGVKANLQINQIILLYLVGQKLQSLVKSSTEEFTN